ncbi:MAG TPA: hypothetical protein VHD62_13340 [Opitutaceae bacterium]|nr:hypothetical protein [Opitutaceae bacterium]
MKNLRLLCLAALVAPAFSSAAPADDVKAAAKKLADAPNFSWTQTSEIANAQFTPGPVKGQTEKDGYTVITREFNGNSSQTVRKGDKVALQNFQTGEWMTREEMMAQFQGGGGGGGAARGGRGGGGGGGMFGVQTPADDLGALVSEVKELKSADGALTGDLTEEGAAQRLSFGGFGRGGQTPPKNATGSVKIWLKDGAVAKYQIHVKGTVNGRNGEQERDVTTTTEIKDVGSTKVTVPEEAKKKLGA